MGNSMEGLLLGFILIAIAIFVLSLWFYYHYLFRKKVIDREGLYTAGIIKGWEEILDIFPASMLRLGKGNIVITNDRFLFVCGSSSKNYRVFVKIPLLDISSVSESWGGITPYMCVTSSSGSSFFRCSNRKLTISRIQAHMRRITEIIDRNGKLEKPMVILQKRLARGEITLDEFHRLVQRL